MGKASRANHFQRLVELHPPHESGLTLNEAIRLTGSVSDAELKRIREAAEREHEAGRVPR
jgi:hypothetical protein